MILRDRHLTAMTPVIILMAMLWHGSHACSFSFGNDVQHGYCTFYTGQSLWMYPINTGCTMTCRCQVNRTTGVSYIPDKGCLESYPCFNDDGTLRNFSNEYSSENIIGNCYIEPTNEDQCFLRCKCKKGYVDYTNPDGKVVRCGTCKGCQCHVNLTSGQADDCSPNYNCSANYLDRINVENTVSCLTTGPNCDLSCQCKSGFGQSDGIECNRCDSCTCPLNLTTGIADCGCNDTFVGKYVPENVNKCWIGLNPDQCVLNCECKTHQYVTDDEGRFCGKFVKTKMPVLSKGGIAGVVVGAIVLIIIAIVAAPSCYRRYDTGYWGCYC